MLKNFIPTNLFSSSSVINIYETGEYYNANILDEEYYPYQFDGWDRRRNYAIVDYNNNVIYPRQSVLLDYTNNNGNLHKNINFVVDAFKDFKNYQQQLIKTNRLNTLSIFSKLNVERSLESAPDLYYARIKELYNVFTNTYLTDNTKKNITDIFSFMEYFIKFVTAISKVTPFNRSSFMKSRFAPISINGLVISLDGTRYNADYAKKANTYISSPEFDHFLATAARYGFFVDRNFPFNIIADLESPIMLKYAKNRGYSSTQDIFEKCYFKAYEADLESLKNVILIFWNSYAFLTDKVVKDRKDLLTENIYLNQLSMEAYEQFYNTNWHIRLYLYLRILEENISTTQNKFENLYQEAIKINKYSDNNNCILFINQKVNEFLTKDPPPATNLTDRDRAIKITKGQLDPLPVEGITF